MIAPILFYGAEVWGYQVYDNIEKVQLAFCKRILGVGSTTSTIAVLGDCAHLAAFARLRCGNHNLMIEKGTYDNIPSNERDEEGVTPWDLADDATVLAVLNFFDSWSDTFNKLLQSLWGRGKVALWDGCNPQVSAVANANSCRMKKLHARPDTRGNAEQYTSGLSVVVPILKVEGKSFVVLNPSSTDHVSLLIEITETPLEDSMQDYTTSFRHRETGRIMTLKLHESIQAMKLIPCEGTNMVICPDLGPRPVTEDFVPIVGNIVDMRFDLKIVEDIDTKMRLIFQREDLSPGGITAPSQLQYNLDESGQENLTISAGIETMPTRYSIANYKEPENPKLEDLRVDPVESLIPLGRVHEDNHELIQQLIRFIHPFTAADLLSGPRDSISPDYVALKDEASGD
ncbi:uncharacterized protein LOC106159461 [Lingula anatina]|uniref:Uncharacterized protein LOC106159461 n=1 Tax=Lingula anatina TaxID=7574 RepID=A0A1S3HYV2_LINAN|nr:uncharacterized protein LOC106159461 [Lingula anatina]|eukprot:XP_013391202.1 uncharacterized protein LOC106159461 [Lingula anatina]